MKKSLGWATVSLLAMVAMSGCWYYESYPIGYSAGYTAGGGVIVEAPPSAVYEDPLWSARPDPYHS